jgi:hypothetical protein
MTPRLTASFVPGTAIAARLAGVVLLPLPGPGLLVIAAGVLLMAEESHVTARALDWLEIQARKLARH